MTTPPSAGTREYLARLYAILDEAGRQTARTEQAGSISQACILLLLPLHRAAAQLSRELLSHGPILPLRRRAEAIARSQTDRLAQLEAILPLCAGTAEAGQEPALYLRRAGRLAREALDGAERAPFRGEPGAAFLEQVLPLLRGESHIAEHALLFPLRPELEEALRALIPARQEEVRTLERLCNALAA